MMYGATPAQVGNRWRMPPESPRESSSLEMQMRLLASPSTTVPGLGYLAGGSGSGTLFLMTGNGRHGGRGRSNPRLWQGHGGLDNEVLRVARQRPGHVRLRPIRSHLERG